MSILILRILFGSVILLGSYDFASVKSFTQMYGEMARVVYSNPKFNIMELLSSRPNRNSRYKTSFNNTILQAWGNNVTLRCAALDRWEKKNLLLVDLKICDLLQIDWVAKWLLKYSNIPATTCPVPAGRYYINDFHLDLKNIPFTIEPGVYVGHMTSMLTKTKEVMGEIEFRVRSS